METVDAPRHRPNDRIFPGMIATIVPELPQYGEQTATVTIVDKVIDAASSTFGVRLRLPNAEQQMPSGLRCLVRFDIDRYGDQMKRVTARNDKDQIQSYKDQIQH